VQAAGQVVSRFMQFFDIDSKNYRDSAKSRRIAFSGRFLGSFGQSRTMIARKRKKNVSLFCFFSTIVLAKPRRAAEAPGGKDAVFGQLGIGFSSSIKFVPLQDIVL
jgi:hypothetical protein